MKPHVLVLGDSLAGLVTAWRLAHADIQVTILKTKDAHHNSVISSTPPSRGQSADSPHEKGTTPGNNLLYEPLIFQGPCPHTESLWKELGTSPKLNWRPVSLEFQTHPSEFARFLQPWLSAPWQSIVGLTGFSGIPFRQRVSLLNFMEKAWEGENRIPSALDLQTAESWLTQIGQDTQTQQVIWNPLCRFLLGTNLPSTRAGSFVAIASQVFLTSRHHGIRIASLANLTNNLKKALFHNLEKQGTTINPPASIEHLQVGMDKISAALLSDGTSYTADWYIVALDPKTLASLLPERWLARYASFQKLHDIQYSPKVIVNSVSSHPIKYPRLILHDGRFSWTLCQPTHLPHGPGTLLSCVATGEPDFLSLSDEHLQTNAMETLHNIFPTQSGLLHTESLQQVHVLRQPFGFTPHIPGIGGPRPTNQSPIQNFLLAGSWTDTDSLTEIESAVASGTRCAQIVTRIVKDTIDNRNF